MWGNTHIHNLCFSPRLPHLASSQSLPMEELNGSHSLLLHGYPHSFSPALMSVLEAIFDTFIPSLPLDEFIQLFETHPPRLPSSSPSSSSSSSSSSSFNGHEPHRKSSLDELRSFYHTSAVQNGVPSYGAGLICSKLNKDLIISLKLALWLLSTRMGTFLLCGKGSLCWKRLKFLKGYSIPVYCFARTFAEIPSKERERILLEVWSRSEKETFRKLFNSLKLFCSFSYFTKLDKQGRNPAWNAIGYCGPDPAASKHREARGKVSSQGKPLDGGVLDAESLKEKLAPKLEEAGFELLKDAEHLEKLWKSKKGGRSRSCGESGERAVVKKVGVKCDAVVVGSGAGGGVVAAVLAQAGHKVLVLEKGKYWARDDLSLLEAQAIDSMYEGGGILATENSSIMIMAGSTVGGGTCINWGASLATPPHVLREWANVHGLSMFGQEGPYAEAMQAVLARLGVSGVASREQESLQNRVLRSGCQSIGFHVADIPTNSGHREHRCGWCGFGCWSGTKQSTAETWLADAVATGNARIVTGISATSVVRRRRKDSDGDGDGRAIAVGVVAESPGLLLLVESRITVVSAGALCTPVLLQRSGLRNRNIGRHLHLHPCHFTWGHFPSSEQVAYEGQIMTAMSSELQQLNPDGHGVILQCPSVHPGVLAAIAPWLSPPDFRLRMRRFSKTVNVIAIARDRGAGAVGSHPLLRHRTIRYELDPRDERDLVEGGVAALRVLIAAGASEVGTHHRLGDRLVLNDQTSEADIERFLALVRSHGIRRLGMLLGSAHQMGSCRMGTDPRTSAVSPIGESWEVSNLFVADSSVLPTALGVNPMITIQSVSYCIAHEALRFLDNQA